MDIIQKANLSAAIFAPGWVFETKSKEKFIENQNRYFEHVYVYMFMFVCVYMCFVYGCLYLMLLHFDQYLKFLVFSTNLTVLSSLCVLRFWELLEPYCQAKGVVGLPLVSAFGRGYGNMLAVNGEVVQLKAWTNHSSMDLQPSFISSVLQIGGKVRTYACIPCLYIMLVYHACISCLYIMLVYHPCISCLYTILVYHTYILYVCMDLVYLIGPAVVPSAHSVS